MKNSKEFTEKLIEVLEEDEFLFVMKKGGNIYLNTTILTEKLSDLTEAVFRTYNKLNED